MPSRQTQSTSTGRQYRGLWVGMLLVALTLAVYHNVGDFDFINLDDNIYIYENRNVQGGLSAESVVWAFSNNTAGMWIPLTWLSYLLDISFQGVSPGAMHLTNLGLHTLNVLVLLVLLNTMTGAFWPSAFAAACFALHPMHVESVAWITERKDVLSTLGFLLTLWQYCRFARRPTAGRYLLTLMLYICTLMAKPMYVTLPFLLLLVDYWPLQRYNVESLRARGITLKGTAAQYLVMEKLPFFFVTVVVTAVTYWAFQQKVAWLHPQYIDLNVRLTNAATAYLMYMGKLFWPVKLSILYPYRVAVSWPQMVATLGTLALISGGVIYCVRTRPYLFVGWFWFLGLLVPVIGLVNAGSYAMADRFAYASFIGLYILVIWGISQGLAGWKGKRFLVVTLAIAAVIAMLVTTHQRVQYWVNSETLYLESIKNTRDNWFLYNSLGNALQRQGKTDQAIGHYRTALRLNPKYSAAYNNLGVAQGSIGQTEDALQRFQAAVRLNPDYADAHYNLGVALFSQGRWEASLGHYLEAIRIQPDNAKAHSNAGGILLRIGRLKEAREYFQAALRLNPHDEIARKSLDAVDHQMVERSQ